MEETSWPNKSPSWCKHNTILLLESPSPSNNTTTVTLSELEENSEKFPINFPIESIRAKTLKANVSQTSLETNINSVYPVIHETSLRLCALFILHKQKFGSDVEKSFYKDMTLVKFVDRLLSKRAISFLNSFDQYVLLDGTKGVGDWETIGTHEEKSPLVLENCLSYDELKLSALLSVSSYTHFINIGNRQNHGVPETDRSKVEEEGVIVGAIGPRFEKAYVMEYRDVIITPTQNTHSYGYGVFALPTMQGVFLNYYGDVSLTYDEIKHQLENNTKYTKLSENEYFNNDVYKKRLALTFDTLLIEANGRAKEKNTSAYVYVVGLGLGVWIISDHQYGVYMDTFVERLEFLSKTLSHVSDVCFAYIRSPSAGKYKNGDKIPIPDHPNKGINVHIINREPHAKLTGSDKGKLLVVSYAWDGNALPGNEFWLGSLAGSGDPAAASSTQVAEIHNPHINPKLTGENLRVATLDGLLTLQEYVDKIKQTVYYL